MNNNITFSMIKPDAVKNGYTGKILDHIIKHGFKIIALKNVKLCRCDAKKFYAVHREKPFYMELVDFMSSGPIIAMVLQKENAVEAFRKVIGATNPADAPEGTIRKLYAESLTRNAIHGADSNENAKIESAFFFSKLEIVG